MGSGYNFSQQHGMSHKEVYERCAHHTRGTVVVLLFAVQATSVQKQKVRVKIIAYCLRECLTKYTVLCLS
jgi:hypothetical protein